MTGNLLHPQKAQIRMTMLETTNELEASNKHCFTKQDSMPRQPRRDQSFRRNSNKKAMVPTIGSHGVEGSVSDLSASLKSFDTFTADNSGRTLNSSEHSSLTHLHFSGQSSIRNFHSSGQNSSMNLHSSGQSSLSNLHSSGQSSSSSLNSPLRRKFSTSSRLSLFSRQRPEKKKNKRDEKKQLPPVLSRWESWEDCTPKGSPQKPQRRHVNVREFSDTKPQRACDDSSKNRRKTSPSRHSPAENDGETSRWSSHSISSSAALASPRRTCSPRKPPRKLPLISLFQPPPLQSPPTNTQEESKREIVFNPQHSGTHRSSDRFFDSKEEKESAHSSSGPTITRRTVLFRQLKAHNLNLRQVSPCRSLTTAPTRIVAPWNPHHHTDADTIRKLQTSLAWEESKRSVTTSSTRDSTASSTAPCPDYSIPWFASADKESGY